MWCASSFHIRMYEWRTRKWRETKCDLSSVLDNPTDTFLLDGECEWRAWPMCHNQPKMNLVPEE